MIPKIVSADDVLIDWDGEVVHLRHRDTQDMRFPAECLHCRNVYDLAAVTIVDRYSDCSTWVSPCCRRLVDDRPVGWGGGIRRLPAADRSDQP